MHGAIISLFFAPLPRMFEATHPVKHCERYNFVWVCPLCLLNPLKWHLRAGKNGLCRGFCDTTYCFFCSPPLICCIYLSLIWITTPTSGNITNSVSLFTFNEIWLFLKYIWRFARFYLQVMEEERINTGKSTEMELKVLSDLNYGSTRLLARSPSGLLVLTLGKIPMKARSCTRAPLIFLILDNDKVAMLAFSGSCTQQPDRANNWQEWGNDQEDHGGHRHQDHRQLHQRHLLLQPRACDHHQGSNTRYFQSWSRGDLTKNLMKSEKIVYILIFKVSSKLRAAYETDLQVFSIFYSSPLSSAIWSFYYPWWW